MVQIVDQLKRRVLPLRIRKDLIEILEKQDLTLSRRGKFAATYFKLGYWYVRGDYLARFIFRKKSRLGAILGCRPVYLKASEATRKYPCIRIREIRDPKIRLFDPVARIKKTVWLYRAGIEREIQGREAFSKGPFSVPELISCDMNNNCIKEALVRGFWTSPVAHLSCDDLIRMLILHHATEPMSCLKYEEYLSLHEKHIAQAQHYLPEKQIKALHQTFKLMQAQAGMANRPPMYISQAHGDLNLDNFLPGDECQVFVFDFEKSMRASAYYDLVYFHLKNERNLGRQALLNALKRMNYKFGINTGSTFTLNWYLSVFVLELNKWMSEEFFIREKENDRSNPFSQKLISQALKMIF